MGQFLTVAFGQLTYPESLRDIETCLRSISGKLYGMGFRSPGQSPMLRVGREL